MSGQDYAITLEPGQTLNRAISGDYIYCKFASQPVALILGGQKLEMESGDKYRPAPFTSFEVVNRHPFTLTVVLTIGKGDYNRQIVQGEITVAPGIRKADGRFQDDTRFSISANITPVYSFQGENLKPGDKEKALYLRGILGDDYAFSEMGAVVEHNGAIYVYIKGSANGANKRGLVKINSDFSGATFVHPNIFGGFFSSDMRQVRDFDFMDSAKKGFVFNIDGNSLDRADVMAPGDSDFSLERIFRAPWPVEGMCTVGKSLFIFNTASQVGREYKVNGLSASFVREFSTSHILAEIGSINAVRYSPITDEFTFTKTAIVSDGSINAVVTSANFEILKMLSLDDGFGSGGGSGGGFNKYVNIGKVLYGYSFTRLADNEPLLKRVSEATELTLKGFASPVACDVSLIDPAFDSYQATAKVTTTQETGRVQVQGELIKAFLEMYYRTRIGADYMDHVYSVVIYSPLDGSVLDSVGGASKTLAALEVKDDFSAAFPGRIDLVIDSTLPKINPLTTI